MIQNCRVQRHQLSATRDHMPIRNGRRKSPSLSIAHSHRRTGKRTVIYLQLYKGTNYRRVAHSDGVANKMSLSATTESLYPIGWLYYSTPSVSSYSPRRLQLHNFIHFKVRMPVQLMLGDDHRLRGLVYPPFGLVKAWADIRDQKDFYHKHEITRLCCSVCRRPSYMEENGSKSSLARQYIRDLCQLWPPTPHLLDLLYSILQR